jgi:Skp family chaperone for outer membrane proteins
MTFPQAHPAPGPPGQPPPAVAPPRRTAAWVTVVVLFFVMAAAGVLAIVTAGSANDAAADLAVAQARNESLRRGPDALETITKSAEDEADQRLQLLRDAQGVASEVSDLRGQVIGRLNDILGALDAAVAAYNGGNPALANTELQKAQAAFPQLQQLVTDYNAKVQEFQDALGNS